MGHNENPNISLVCGLDLSSQKEVISDYLCSKQYKLPVYYTNENESHSQVNGKLEHLLDMIITKHKINCVIISTEPLSHVKYTKFALSRGLNILLDKPITAHSDVVNSMEKAKCIYQDYIDIKIMYLKAQKLHPNLVFNVMAQRRFHPTFQFAQKMLLEINNLTNCPVTSYQLSHSDGQWRFPTEIIEQNYHPYNQGYGKCSHSGYHMYDIFSWLITSTLGERKMFDFIDLNSQAVYPNDLINQVSYETYNKLFPNFDEFSMYSEKDFLELSQNYGEVDCFTQGSFGIENKTTTIWSVNLLHNGSSQRNWVDVAGKDLYKGNGRIKHESHYIVQGPFQAILIESYQSLEDRESEENSYNFGDKNHLDVHVFRNSKLFPQFKPHVEYSATDISRKMKFGEVSGTQEESRYNCISEFFENIFSSNSASRQISNFFDHAISCNILSMVYQSLIQRKNGISPVIRSTI